MIRGSGLGIFTPEYLAKMLKTLVTACARIEEQKIQVCMLSDVESTSDDEDHVECSYFKGEESSQAKFPVEHAMLDRSC